MKEYLTLFIVLGIILVAGLGILFLGLKYFLKKDKPVIEIDEEKIVNKPEGKGGQDDKNTLDDIADKYNLDGK